MKKTVGENLKMFRIKKGLSMEEAGKKIGVSAPAILKYERNKIIASLERLEEFAKIIDILVKERLIKIDKNYLKCTKKGFIIQDQIIVKFFEYI